MIEIDISSEIDGLKVLPETTVDEIIQNVQMIIGTLQGEVPLYREFGINSAALDLPVGAAQARISSEIISAVAKFEPRAKVKNVLFSGSGSDGEVRAKIRIAIDENAL